MIAYNGSERNGHKPNFGRPTKLTEETARTIFKALEIGNYLETAAAMASVTANRFATGFVGVPA